MASKHSVDALHLTDDSEYAQWLEDRARLNEEARDNYNDDDWWGEQAAVITDTIFQGFDHENVLQLFSTVQRNVGKFDRVTISESRGLKAYWLARGGYIRMSSMFRDTVELPRAIVGFHVGDETEKLAANWAESMDDLIGNGVKRMDGAVNQYAFALFQAAIASGNANYHTASSLSLATLDAAVSSVFDYSDEVTIVGRRPMTDQINSLILNLAGADTLFIPETNERLMQLGVLAKYRGANVVQIKNFRDDLEVPFLPANELWVVGRDSSTSAFFGGLDSKEWEEDDNWYRHFMAKREFGMMVHRPTRLHRIIDTHIAPTQGTGDSYAAA